MADSIIRKYKNSGNLKFYYDYRAGHTNDLSGLGTNGTLGAAVSLNNLGADLNATSTSIITHAHNTAQDLYPMTLVALVKTGTTASDTPFVNKYVAASGNGYMLNCDSGKVYAWYFWGGVANNYVSAGAHGIGGQTINDGNVHFVSFTVQDSGGELLVDGGTPVAGNWTGTPGATTTTADLIIGKYQSGSPAYFRGNVGAVLGFNVVLSRSELAQLMSELRNTTWPTKSKSDSLVDSSTPKQSSGLIESWDMGIQNGVVYGLNGYNSSSIAGRYTVEKTRLGNATVFSSDVLSYASFANNNVFNSYPITYEVWFAPDSVAAGDKGILNKYSTGSTNGWTVNRNGSSIRAWYYKDVSNFCAVTDGGTLRVNTFSKIVVTVDSSGLKIYQNGTQVGSTTAWTGTPGATTSSQGVSIGVYAGTAGAASGKYIQPQVFNYAKTAAQIKADYERESKFVVPFKTDFGAKVSTSDEGGTSYSFLSNTPFQFTSSTTGRWRVAMSTINGTPVKVINNTTIGEVYLDSTKHYGLTEGMYGSWDFWFYKPDTAAFTFAVTGNGGQDGYGVTFGADESFAFGTVTAGVPTYVATKTSAITANTWNHFQLTRTNAGVFSFYLNGSLISPMTTGTNPYTNTTYTSADSIYIIGDTATGCMLSLGDTAGNYAFSKSNFA